MPVKYDPTIVSTRMAGPGAIALSGRMLPSPVPMEVPPILGGALDEVMQQVNPDTAFDALKYLGNTLKQHGTYWLKQDVRQRTADALNGLVQSKPKPTLPARTQDISLDGAK